MKRFFLVLIIGIALLSCNNEKIETDVVKTPEPFVTLSYNVSTSSTYEPFGIDDYKKLLSSDYNNNIGLFTYVYDANGDRIDSLFSYTKTFSEVQQNFQLPKGNYTLVTIETIVNADYEYASDYWSFVNTEKLNTSEICLRDTATTYWDAIIGVSTNKINITSSLAASASPEPLGSLVQVEHTNFDKTNYTILLLVSDNSALGFKLNPSLSGDERYDWLPYNANHVWNVRGGEVNRSGLSYSRKYTLYVLEESNLTWGFAPTTFNDEGEVNNFTIYPNSYSSNGRKWNLEKGKIYYAGVYCLDKKKQIATFFGDDKTKYAEWWLKQYAANKESESRSANLTYDTNMSGASKQLIVPSPINLENKTLIQKLTKIKKGIHMQ